MSEDISRAVSQVSQGGKPTIRPNSNGYVPKPLDTRNVELSDNVLLLGERLAGHMHDTWGKGRVDEGWAYGKVRDEKLKTNPLLMYYNELSEEQKEDNRKAAFEALRFIISKGYSIEERKDPSMADIMKMAWTDHGRKAEDLNFDATVYIGVFGTDERVDEKNLTSALRSWFTSLYEMFGQKKALSGSGRTIVSGERFKKYAHTRFAILSPLETETERIAAKVAAGYGIDTFKVVNDGTPTDRERRVIGVSGDIIDSICDSSLMALAMWNGNRVNHADRRMTDIVERALKGSQQRLMELEMPDNITVFHLLTPCCADDTGTADHKLYTVRALHPFPLESGKNWYFRGGKSKAQKTDKYNEDRFNHSVGKIAEFNRTVKKRRGEVMSSRQVYDLMPGLHGYVATDRDLLRHIYTDAIACNAQTRRDRQTKWMMGTAVIGLGASALMPDMPQSMFGLNTAFLRPLLCAVMLLFLTIAMVVFLLQRRSGSHNEYVDFRMLAECLRVQTYWRAAGIDDSVEDDFGAKSKFDFEWARFILRSWDLSDSMYRGEDKPFSGSMIHEVTRIWLGREDEFAGGEYRREKTGNVDQYGYTRSKAEKSVKDARKERRIQVGSITVAYGITVFVALMVLVVSLVKREAYYADWFDYLAMFAGVVQVVAAGCSLFSATKDYDRVVNNTTWLSIEYQKAIVACKYAPSEEHHRRLLKITGNEAIREACGWALEFGRNEPSSPIS